MPRANPKPKNEASRLACGGQLVAQLLGDVRVAAGAEDAQVGDIRLDAGEQLDGGLVAAAHVEL